MKTALRMMTPLAVCAAMLFIMGEARPCCCFGHELLARSVPERKSSGLQCCAEKVEFNKLNGQKNAKPGCAFEEDSSSCKCANATQGEMPYQQPLTVQIQSVSPAITVDAVKGLAGIPCENPIWRQNFFSLSAHELPLYIQHASFLI